MTRFEYKWAEFVTAKEVTSIEGTKIWQAVDSLEDILNKFGNEGWELVYYEAPDRQAVRFGILSLPRGLFKRMRGEHEEGGKG